MLRVETPSGLWEGLTHQVLDFLRADLIHLVVDGGEATGFRSPDSPALWIRDHSDILRAGVFMHPDVHSAVDLFAAHQSANGRVFDYVTTEAGTEPENWEKWVRVPVEADVEFRFVKAAYLAWQASGDDAWMEALLPQLDAALTYTRTHPWRWDRQLDLPKRAYTPDTWDFDYTAGRNPWLNFQVTEHTFWGIMHGDVSGMVEAMHLLAELYEHARQPDAASSWRADAEALRERANALLFNGRFYTHFHKITPVTIEGVDEAEQLTLSNPMDINRGLATHEMAVEILQASTSGVGSPRAHSQNGSAWSRRSRQARSGTRSWCRERMSTGASCRWWAASWRGRPLSTAFERYGIQILDQYRTMIAETGETYLWYFPDGTASTPETSTSPDAMPTDGWGSSAMLFAFVEGLCGIEDQGHSYQQVRCSPRWAATDELTASVQVGYEASGASFGYSYTHDADANSIRLRFDGEADVDLHLLLPKGARPLKLTWGGESREVASSTVQESVYADAQGRVTDGTEVEVRYVRT